MARVYRCTFRGHHSNGALFQPSLHYQTDLEPLQSEPDPDDVANTVWNALGETFRSCVATFDHIDELVALEEVVPPAIGVAGATTRNIGGSLPSAGKSTPHGTVAIINKHTNTRSRSARGWLAMPSPMDVDYINLDLWDQPSGYWTALQVFADLMDNVLSIGGIAPSQLVPVVYSRKRHRAGLSPYTFRLTTATVNPQIHWLRTRMTSP